MYRTALGAFEQVSPNLLGGRAHARRRANGGLPHASCCRSRVPVFIAGTVLAFARALGEFGATLMIAGNIPGRTQTMPVAIFFAAEAGDLYRAMLWVALTAGAVACVHCGAALLGHAATPPAWPATVLNPSPPRRWQSARRPARRAHGRHPQTARRLHARRRFSNRGRALGLLGASGSGKSMTLRCIAGLETPDEGRIVLNGRVLFDSKAGISLSPAERRIGIVFQDHALFPHLTVRQNIAFGLRPRRRPRPRRRGVGAPGPYRAVSRPLPR